MAIANSLAASGAYWIASQADELVVTTGGMVGSIGIVMVHEDWSKANEMAGVKPTYLTAGKYKAEGNFDEPLGDGAREFLQGQLREYYGLFASAVARGRRTTPDRVSSGYGEGRVLTAQMALKAGMVDRVETFEQTLAVVAGGGNRGPAATDTTDRARLERMWEIAMMRPAKA